MPPRTVSARDILYAQLDALLNDFDNVADHAPYGETVNELDAFLFVHGRDFIKQIFQQKLQERIAQKEKTNEAKQCSDYKKNANARHENENTNLRLRTNHHQRTLSTLSPLLAAFLSTRSRSRYRPQIHKASKVFGINMLCTRFVSCCRR